MSYRVSYRILCGGVFVWGMLRGMEAGKYVRAWRHNDSPLLWVEILYIADTQKLPALLGFFYGGHCFVSRNQCVTFYLNREIARKASVFGSERYRDQKFMEMFIGLTVSSEQVLRAAVEAVRKGSLESLEAPELAAYYKDFVGAYANFMALYRFTRPEFYESVVAETGVTERLQALGSRRLEMHRVWAEEFQSIDSLFQEIGRRINMSVLEVANSTTREVLNFLESTKVPDKEEILKRLHHYTFLYTESGFTLSTSNTLQHLESNQLEVNSELLRGQAVYPGVVRGRVFILNESLRGAPTEEMERMGDGQILVTEMTSPDMIQAIRKASAIVTNHGGTLSHAAIVSREFQIPCIVGTGEATAILKNDDLVEVDATNGIVRKL